MKMTSSRPYLIRALYQWIIDNECTPYILVNALDEDVSVPQDYVNPEGQVVLNISPGAVQQFSMDDDSLAFSARFGGVSTDIYTPYSAVLGIYAKENQQGMIFEPEPHNPDDPSPPSSSKKLQKPGLRIVK